MAERAQILIRAKDETASAFSSVQRNFSSVHSTLARIAPQIAAALSVGGVIAFAKSAIDAADAMNDLSQRTGISVESLSKWKFVAEQSGATLESIQPGLKGLAQNLESAARGSKESADAFQRLGVPVKDGAGNLRQMDEVMLDLADKFSKMPDGAQKTALAVRIFGKAGQELIPTLNQGRDGIAELMATAERMGVVMSKEAAAAADEFNDSVGLIKTSFNELAIEFVKKSAPALSRIAKEMANAAKEGSGLSAIVRGLRQAFTELLLPGGGDLIEQERLRLRNLREELQNLRLQLQKIEGLDPRQRGLLGLPSDAELRQRIENIKSETIRLQAWLKQQEDLEKSIRTPEVGVTPTGELPETEAERQKKILKASQEKQKLMQAELDYYARMDEAINGAIEVGDKETEKKIQNRIRQMQIDAEYIARSDADINAVIALAEKEALIKDEKQQRDLDRLRTSLMTDSELLRASYEQDFDLLNNTLGMKKDAQQEYYKLLERLYRKNANSQMAIEMQKNQALRSMQISTWQLGVGLLQSLSGESKAAAYAVIAVNTGLAMSQAIQATAVAIMRAYSDLGPIAGTPAAARIALLGKIQLGLIAAASVLQAANVGKGTAVGTFSANPSTGLPESSSGFGFQPPPSPLATQGVAAPVPQQINFTIVSDSGLISTEWMRDKFAPAWNELMGDRVNVTIAASR